MAIQDILESQNSAVMPLVRFERRAEEDRAATRAAGHYIAKDVDFALVTPPYSKDVMHHKLPNWFEQLELDAQRGRVPREWVQKVKQAYEFFQRGQEMPLDGAPIRGWGVISPAQQETLCKMGILTVETLAAVNDEGIRRIGMGANDLKQKAIAWLKTMEKGGKPTLEIAALRKENDQLKGVVASLEEKIEQLIKLAQAAEQPIGYSVGIGAGIDAGELFED